MITSNRNKLAVVVALLCLSVSPGNATGQVLGRSSGDQPSSARDVQGVALHPLAVRSGPGKRSSKKAEFPKGSKLVFLSPPGCMDGYCFVQGPRGIRGWILAEAVKRTPNNGAGKGSRADIAGYATSPHKLNLRSGPSKFEDQLAIVQPGEIMQLLKSPPCRNGYCFVELPNRQRGWVLRSVISIHGF
ncbi:hypothetical protein [Aquamicrobium sp.]|uniref:SH3 domain-containing protein n=1 Tax=Aquamicrobium sp. TaxID=1872579 RepID=UPI00259022DF|nr:hypothetical protein [Aquamicrobium sp.]MCK9549234.1 hypothetical protein [Aquamicrobium sp.]